MKKLAAFMTALCLAVFINGISVFAADSDAAVNNTPATALDLGNVGSSSFNSSLADENDEDWYKISFRNDGCFKLNFSHEVITGSGSFWEISLLKKDGKTVVHSIFSVANATDTSTCSLGINAGDYYIKIKSGTNFSDAEYTVSTSFNAVENFETEDNNSAENADTAALDKLYSGALMNKNDVDWYCFTIDKAGCLDIKISHEANSQKNDCWNFTVYKDDGTTAVNSWNLNGTDETTSFPLMCLKEGKYFLKVARGSYYYNTNYSFSINYTEVSDWETESNDTADTANAIENNVKYTGTTMNGNDADWYKITLDEEKVINFDIEHSEIDSPTEYWTVALYQSDGTSLIFYVNSAGNDSVKKSPSVSLQKGVYYIKVKPCGVYTYNYDKYYLTVNTYNVDNWEAEVNDTSESANNILTNKEYYFTTLTATDVDWFKFNAESDGYIKVDFSHKIIDNVSNYWNVKIYRDDAKTLIYSMDMSGSKEIVSTPTIGILKGDYYISVSAASSTSWLRNDVGITVNYNPDNHWEKEDNNTVEKAVKIEKDVRVGGNTMDSEDNDWYSFDIDTDGKYKIVFEYPDADGQDVIYWQIDIRESDGETVIKSKAVNAVGKATCLEPTLTAGTYCIKVSPVNINTSDYFLTVSAGGIKGDVDRNGKISSADALAVLMMVVGADDVNIAIADIDGSGDITSSDALRLLEFVIGNIAEL